MVDHGLDDAVELRRRWLLIAFAKGAGVISQPGLA